MHAVLQFVAERGWDLDHLCLLEENNGEFGDVFGIDRAGKTCLNVVLLFSPRTLHVGISEEATIRRVILECFETLEEA